ncbi:hypothetical protein COLO4_10688 [Corchorus olitorius]|uniref:Uncharacterized protein n=1 Tax=Corchorus olitorius TaxID=93759 RepID=A0A1R3K7C5_9ROSI|nr:hypothetical protein COLO4_10688 [Corchorus olitorius]
MAVAMLCKTLAPLIALQSISAREISFKNSAKKAKETLPFRPTRSPISFKTTKIPHQRATT